MPLTIDIDDREFDTVHLRNALTVPVERNYAAELTVDAPNGEDVFHGDVTLQGFDGDTLIVREFVEDGPDIDGTEHRFELVDIRRISLY
jgi:hypothetical protein